jgi:hypothetical protein
MVVVLLLQKCYKTSYQKYWICNKSKRAHYAEKLGENIEQTNIYHHKLYLNKFKDPRLQVGFPAELLEILVSHFLWHMLHVTHEVAGIACKECRVAAAASVLPVVMYCFSNCSQAAALLRCGVCVCLQDYWTHKKLNEVNFVPRLAASNATNVLINGTKTLWVSLLFSCGTTCLVCSAVAPELGRPCV